MTVRPAREEFINHLHYDPRTGRLAYKNPTGNTAKGGRETTLDGKGYPRISYRGKRYIAHRVIWYMVFGDWPDCDIDHIDGDRTNNRLDNLRLVNRSQNLRRQLKRDGLTSIYKGVFWNGSKWIAQVKGYIGSYACEKEAGLAYNYRARQLYGEYARFNQVFVDMPEGVLNGEA